MYDLQWPNLPVNYIYQYNTRGVTSSSNLLLRSQHRYILWYNNCQTHCVIRSAYSDLTCDNFLLKVTLLVLHFWECTKRSDLQSLPITGCISSCKSLFVWGQMKWYFKWYLWSRRISWWGTAVAQGVCLQFSQSSGRLLLCPPPISLKVKDLFLTEMCLKEEWHSFPL